VTGLRRPPMVGDHQRRSAAPSTGVQVTEPSAPEEPGGRLGWLFHWWLGSCQGRVQVGSDLGMTCSVLPTWDCQLRMQLARRWPRLVRAAGLTVTLCPATCSLTEMVTAHLRSVGDGRTYPVGKPVTKCPLGSRMWSVAVALITARPAAAARTGNSPATPHPARLPPRSRPNPPTHLVTKRPLTAAVSNRQVMRQVDQAESDPCDRHLWRMGKSGVALVQPRSLTTRVGEVVSPLVSST
jgi:hypothetical protein